MNQNVSVPEQAMFVLEQTIKKKHRYLTLQGFRTIMLRLNLVFQVQTRRLKNRYEQGTFRASAKLKMHQL